MIEPDRLTSAWRGTRFERRAPHSKSFGGMSQAIGRHNAQHYMNEQASLAEINFTENGQVDVAQLNELYRLIGWDRHNRRTEVEPTEMLRVSHSFIAAHTAEGPLVGFARVWRSVRCPRFRWDYAPCVSPARACHTRYAWGARTPSTIPL